MDDKLHYYILLNNFFRSLIRVVLAMMFLTTSGQKAPLPVEVFIGHRAINYQHVINKDILKGKLSFFNVSSFEAEHSQNENNTFSISTMVSYNLVDGLSLGLGGEIQRPGTFAFIGAQYSYATKEILLVLFPSLNINGAKEITKFVLFEYRPKLTRRLRAYLRTQFLVITDFNSYNRGYQQIRLGLQLSEFQLGLAVNFDQFNNGKINSYNLGFFFRALLF